MKPAPPGSDLKRALGACRTAFVAVGLLSGASNILMLTGSFYMLQVYDRVLPSRSVPTLVGLSVLAAMLFAFMGLQDLIRSRLMARIAGSLDRSVSPRLYETVLQMTVRGADANSGLQPIRDIDSIRSFLASQGTIALFDIPWVVIYLAICFAFHFWIGMAALIGAIVLVALTLLSEMLTRVLGKEAFNSSGRRMGFAETSRRNAETVIALGMSDRFAEKWRDLNTDAMFRQQRLADVTSGLGVVSKFLRMSLQSGVLGLGAYLVIQQEATAGIIIASSILTARALAPIDLAIAHWKGFVAARQSWARLTRLLAAYPVQEPPMALPRPNTSLSVENISTAPPGTQRLVLSDVSFALKAGQGLGIIGPSASGKSSLARLLVGVWRPVRGKVCLDGATLDQWTSTALGSSIGYLPQNVELLSGTVAQNIARFETDASTDAIVDASRTAGVHDMIVSLPGGYDMQVGEQGGALSAGQRQRVGLARALYGNPFLIVLDEPNSNLDAEGEAALTRAILASRARGAIVVVVAHRPSALAGVDLLLTLSKGQAQAFGPKDKVIAALRRNAAPQGPLKVVSDGER
jgi:ATP-binding cassette subfamily C protein